MEQHSNHTIGLTSLRVIAVVVVVASLTSFFSAKAVPPVTLAISQTPLTVTTASHPKILFALGNSQSMDGDLSGAILTGAGSLPAGLTSLYNGIPAGIYPASIAPSPVNYAVPSGFTPPIQGPDAFGNAPYTVTQGGHLVDNSASRLNVAKAGITSILQNYIRDADFALATYNTSGTGLYTTWVYYMSPLVSVANPTGSFIFTNTQTNGNLYVTNPCYHYTTASATVQSNCASIAANALWPNVANSQYMQISATSDDPSINDVFYANGFPGVFITYNGPNPAGPFPPFYSLAQYESGSVTLTYSSTSPNVGAFGEGPTNAGFVPFTKQVMNVQRGFGFFGGQSGNSGTVVVPMTSVGTNPTNATVTAALNIFAPYLNPETNSTGTSDIKASAVQSPIAGLLAQSKSYLNGVSNLFGGCPQQKYAILISDGLPTDDLAGHYWPPLGSAAGAGYGVTATFNSDGSLNTTNDQALTDTIANLTNLKNAGINTYIIGLGAGVDPTVNPQAAATLQAMAIAGGTVNYFPASSPTVLVNDLNSILLSILTGSLSTTSAAVNASRLLNGTVEYQTTFTARDTPSLDWTGDLYEMALNTATGVPTGPKLWSAQALLDTQAAADTGNGVSPNRVIATCVPSSGICNNGSGIPFQWTSLSSSQQAVLQPSDSLGQSRLNYLRGSKALEVQNGGTFRNRSHILGDITDSQPVYVGVPSSYTAPASYISFINANASRQAMLYVGGNDGMLHAINAATGSEQFAYIPSGVFNNLINLTQPTYNQNHQFFVDGSPQSGDVQFGGSGGAWHTILVGGENGGGQSIYALDITNPSSLTNEAAVSNAVLWEFTDTDLGLTYSEPQIAPVNTPSAYAVFFGNGYNSTNNKAVLYAVNPQTGALISKIDLCAAVSGACNAALPQGLSTPAVGNSNGLQAPSITQVYAGDLQGNLWAVDVSNANPASWVVRLLFQARDSGGTAQPITTQPQVTLNPNFTGVLGNFVIFGTGQLLTDADLTNTQTQSIYGIWDKPGNSTVLARGNLVSQSLSLATNLLSVTNNSINWTTKFGWFVDLFTPGLRVVTAPQLLNGALLSTLNLPPGNTCGANFSSYFVELNFQNGGSFGKPVINVNGSFLVGNNTVGFGLGSGYASAPTIIGVTSQNFIASLVTQSGGMETSILNTNSNPRRLGWWQPQ